jgi:hypothetical protein
MEKDMALLAALRAAALHAGGANLPPETVRGLGAVLGISDTALIERVEALAGGELLRLRWGGAVELTEKAHDLLDGRRGEQGGGVHVSGDYIVQQNSPHATAGRGAIGAGAVVGGDAARNEALGAIVLALALLRDRLNALDGGDVAERAREIEATAAEVVAEGGAESRRSRTCSPGSRSSRRSPTRRRSCPRRPRSSARHSGC